MTFDPTQFRDEYPWSGSFLERPGGRMHYLDIGEGEPVLLLHGNPTWSFMWRKLLPSLEGRRCIVPDHIGMGLSDKPDDADYEYTLDRRVDDIEALLAHVGVERDITLIAHDWGGMIGLATMLRNPDRFRRVVLMNTSGFPLPKGSALPWQLWLVKNLPFALPVRGMNAFVRGALRGCIKRPEARTELVRRAYMAPYDSWAHRIAVHRFVEDIPLGPGDRAWTTVSAVSDSLTKLCDKPTLLCWGRKDFIFNDAFLAEWQRRLPNAETLILPDAGHYLMEDAPAQVPGRVAEFLAAHPLEVS